MPANTSIGLEKIPQEHHLVTARHKPRLPHKHALGGLVDLTIERPLGVDGGAALVVALPRRPLLPRAAIQLGVHLSQARLPDKARLLMAHGLLKTAWDCMPPDLTPLIGGEPDLIQKTYCSYCHAGDTLFFIA